ncbi:MAG: SIMPL domain-containing protein [Nitrosopumilus sp.]
MKKSKQLLVAVITVLVVSVSLGTIATTAYAQEEPTLIPSTEKTISVTGMATTSIDPDLLTVSLGIETQGLTASEALSANSEKMNSVIKSLKSIGIEESEISTSSLNIHAQYEYIEDGFLRKETRQLTGYEASNIITIETKKLDLAASIIDSAVNSGANRVDSVYFSVSPGIHASLKDELLEKAITNAKSKAETALDALDQKIIGVKTVALSEFGVPYPQPMFRSTMAFEADSMAFSAPTPVFSSEQDVTTSAHVVFIIGSN